MNDTRHDQRRMEIGHILHASWLMRLVVKIGRLVPIGMTTLFDSPEGLLPKPKGDKLSLQLTEASVSNAPQHQTFGLRL